MDIPPITSYVSTTIDLDLSAARRAFDAARRDREAPASPYRWIVRAGRARLELLGPGIPIEPVGGAAPVRVVPGAVRCGSLRARVELELCPWSGTRSELGLRLMSRWASDRYRSVASDLLDVLAAELELRALVGADLQVLAHADLAGDR